MQVRLTVVGGVALSLQTKSNKIAFTQDDLPFHFGCDFLIPSITELVGGFNSSEKYDNVRQI